MPKPIELTEAQIVPEVVMDPYMRLAQIANNGVDFASRTIYINGEITAERTLIQIPALRIMDEEEGPVRVLINSPGGDSQVGVALFDTMKAMVNEVVTVNVSNAYSIAALILQGGDVRLALPNSELMIHNGHMVVEATDMDNGDLQDLAAHSEKFDNQYHRIISQATGLSIAKISKWCGEETFLDAKKCLNFGFIDGIVNKSYLNTKIGKKK